MSTTILWYRRDLRLHDHAALWHAVRDATAVIPLFILDPAHFANREVGSGRVQFLLESLSDLDDALRRCGSRLFLARGRAEDVLPQLVHALGAAAVYHSADIERWSGQVRDRTLARLAAEGGWRFQPFLNYFLQTDGVYDRESWAAARTAHSKEPLYAAPEQIPTPGDLSWPEAVERFDGVPTLAELGLPANQQAILPGGEAAGRARLETFLRHHMSAYRGSISSPSLSLSGGTSLLSPYIKFGCLSVREAVQMARGRWLTSGEAGRKGLEAWTSRLAWRDHFIQKFALYPQAEFVNLYRPFDAVRRPEDADPALLAAWQQGRTGYPLVDASMRCLLQTGLLNFRMRAMLATFLTLNLFQAWQHGAEWFMRHLLDGDACIDHWQWQMQSGITQPERAFIRGYNPTKQAHDHDPAARFIHAWLPELRPLPAPLVFQPWTLTPMEETLFGVRLDEDYPRPVVDAAATRQRALDILQPIRQAVAAADDRAAQINELDGITPAVRLAEGAPAG
jgi:deoxyribodipyrimidine photo-lyase